MKKKYLVIAALLFASVFVACKDDNTITTADQPFQSAESQAMSNAIDAMPFVGLTPDVEEGLIFMREEEKLARDVYRFFYEKYGLRIFRNISRSESMHMAALKKLLDKYELNDPVVNDEIGKFQNEDLAQLYVQLTETGSASLLEALKVGLTIEDLDIRDLMAYETEIDSRDIIYVYENLTRGSRNHLRAYYRLTTRNGGTYEAQFISQELFESIINSPHERGGW